MMDEYQASTARTVARPMGRRIHCSDANCDAPFCTAKKGIPGGCVCYWAVWYMDWILAGNAPLVRP
jgi:hypothetical protein